MFCPKCGKMNQKSAQFCNECGYKLPVLNDLENPENKSDAESNKVHPSSFYESVLEEERQLNEQYIHPRHREVQNLLDKAADPSTSQQNSQQPSYPPQKYFQQPYFPRQYNQPIPPVSFYIRPPVQKPVSPTRIVFGILFIVAGIYLGIATSLVSALISGFLELDSFAGILWIPSVFTLATGIVLVASCKTFTGGYISFVMILILAFMFSGDSMIRTILLIVAVVVFIVTIVAQNNYNTAVRERNQQIREAQEAGALNIPIY